MCLQELATCMQYQLPIKIICLNNQALGMVKQWQDMQYGGRHSHSTYAESLPDFVKLVESYGHVGIKIEKLADLESGLKKAFSLKNKLVFVDVMVDPDEHVYPMAIKGGAMKDMILSKTERT
jgi:acetolactate synthase-1/2/3 large subunit